VLHILPVHKSELTLRQSLFKKVASPVLVSRVLPAVLPGGADIGPVTDAAPETSMNASKVSRNSLACKMQ
jgi:hypothetical protein